MLNKHIVSVNAKVEEVNRTWLKDEVAAGRTEAQCNYRYQEDNKGSGAFEFSVDFLPARIKSAPDDEVEGHVNFEEGDFESASGRAYRDEVESEWIRLIVDSGAYTLRRIETS